MKDLSQILILNGNIRKYAHGLSNSKTFPRIFDPGNWLQKHPEKKLTKERLH